MTNEPTSASRPLRRHLSRRHGSRANFSRWLSRSSSGKRMFKRLLTLAVYMATALSCLWIGYYYLGPKLTNMGE